MKTLDLTGKRFGHLIAIKYIISGREKNGHRFWLCQCDCGKFTKVRVGHLMSGQTRGCGCRQKLPTGEAVFNQIIDNYKRNAKKFNREFILTKEQFRELTKGDCYYCGTEPSTIKENCRMNGIYIYNGIDRIDNTKGYIKDNCVSCCRICNWMKMNLSAKEFLNHIKKIYESSMSSVK